MQIIFHNTLNIWHLTKASIQFITTTRNQCIPYYNYVCAYTIQLFLPDDNSPYLSFCSIHDVDWTNHVANWWSLAMDSKTSPVLGLYLNFLWRQRWIYLGLLHTLGLYLLIHFTCISCSSCNIYMFKHSSLIYITACCRRQCKVAEDHEKDDPTPRLSQNKATPLLT